MENSILKKIELEQFTNRMALDMGLAIITLAQKNHHNIAVKIERLNHTVFLYVDEGLPADKHLWLNRKANVAKHFEESSLNVKKDLFTHKMSLKDTFALDDNSYLAKGGAIPIFVKNAGMVGVITVSGLSDEEDHAIIIEALQHQFFK